MDRTEVILDELRTRGHRVTDQRRAIIEEVTASHGHIAPSDIYRRVRARVPAVNESTVYRTIELLEEAGYLAHSHLGAGEAGYHHADRHDHVHLLCSRCGVEDTLTIAEARPLEAELIARKGFHPDFRRFAISGLCRACAESDQTAEAGSKPKGR